MNLIKSCITKVVLVGARVAHSSEVESEIVRVGTLHTSPISIRISLVGVFMLHFSLVMRVNPITVIILAKVVVIL